MFYHLRFKNRAFLFLHHAMKIEENKELRPYHTFHLDVKAKYFAKVKTVDDLLLLLNSSIYRNNPSLVLGGGSNLLFTGDLNGLVIKLSIMGITTLAEDEDEVELKIGAGQNWHELVMYCVDRGYGGIENLSLIPGTVGAAPMQNIGAYGVEIREVFTELEAVEIATGKIKAFSNEACKFGYRDSIFKNKAKGRYVITSVTLKLSKKPIVNTSYGAIKETLTAWGIEKPGIADVSKAVIHIRQSKLPDPNVIGNAGSFFKNPSIDAADFEKLKVNYPAAMGYVQADGTVKVPAAWLIEQAGWKGKTFGEIGVHKNQALVLVNYGEGTGRDIWDLAQKIQASVQEKFGIALVLEVNVV